MDSMPELDKLRLKVRTVCSTLREALRPLVEKSIIILPVEPSNNARDSLRTDHIQISSKPTSYDQPIRLKVSSQFLSLSSSTVAAEATSSSFSNGYMNFLSLRYTNSAFNPARVGFSSSHLTLAVA